MRFFLAFLILFFVSLGANAQTTPSRAHDFTSKLSIQGGISGGGSPYLNAAQQLADVQYLGITHYRDGLNITMSGSSLAALTALIQGGISMDAQVPYGTVAPATQIAQIQAWQALGSGAVAAIEGINEPEIATTTYLGNTGGGNGATTWKPEADFMIDYITAINGTLSLAGIPIFGVSRVGAEPNNVGLQYVTIPAGPPAGVLEPANSVMAGNFTQHIYPTDQQFLQGGVLPACQTNDPTAGNAFNIDMHWNAVQTFAGGFAGAASDAAAQALPKVFTEFGYPTANPAPSPNGDRVNADKAGRCTVSGLINGFIQGYTYESIYTLYDLSGDGFGMFTSSGVPSTQGNMVHNLTTVLSDAGATAASFTVKPLTFNVSGMPATGATKLFQTSDGHYKLAIWDNASNWNFTTGTPITVGPTSVTVSVNIAAIINRFDTSVGVASQATARGTSISVPLTDAVQILDIAPIVPTGSLLPNGFFTVTGNQIKSGTGANVRMSCADYVINVPTVAPDIASIKSAGFNCVRVPYFDSSLNLTTLDAVVTAATTNSLKVIFVHQGNEAASVCGVRQKNGVWYDLNGAAPNNTTNGTDGCGTTGTITYTTFKANWVSIANHYATNSTVIGFDLHHEPMVTGAGLTTAVNWGGGNGSDAKAMCGDVGNAIRAVATGQLIICEGVINQTATFFDGTTQAASGGAGATGIGDLTLAKTKPITAPGGSGTGQFVIKNGQILDPNGNLFVARGINVVYENITGSVGPQVTLASLQANFPRINYVRLSNFLGGGYTDGITPGNATVLAFINQLTAKGIVVQIEDYPGNGICRSGADLTAAAAWYTQYATLLSSQPNSEYIFYETQNECFDTAGGGPSRTQITTNYNAIRAAAPNAIILIGSAGGSPDPAGGEWYFTQALFAPMTNVGFDIHPYPGVYQTNSVLSGPLTGQNCATSQATEDACLSGWITTYTQWISGTPGNMPVLLGEFGNAQTPANGPDANGPITVQAGADVSTGGPASNGSSFGYGYWEWTCGCDPIQSLTLVNPNGTLTSPYGTQVAGIIAASPGTGPTPFTGGGGGTGAAITNVVYSAHLFPTNVSGATPDSGANAVTYWNHAFGYLETTNTAPVWIGAMGASLDNSNGNLADDTAWANLATSYVNGSAVNGPSFTTCLQPISIGWFAWASNPTANPNGILNPDGTFKAVQETYWTQLQYTPSCSGSTQTTTWNPNDTATGITLSNNNLTATTTVATSVSTRSTTSKASGKFCWEIAIVTVNANWDGGIANATYSLTAPNGLGGDANGLGLDPNSTGGLQGVFYNNALLSSGAVSSANGDAATMCADFGTQLYWVTTSAMRGAGNPWNNSASALPDTETGGLSFSGLTGPYFITWNDFDSGGVATLNTIGPFAVSLPAGFSTWDTGVTSSPGRPLLINFSSLVSPELVSHAGLGYIH